MRTAIEQTRHRAQSETNIYHVTTRGVAQQIIFEDDIDRTAMLNAMQRFLIGNGIEIFAWCFMGNHVHFLLHGEIEMLSRHLSQCFSWYAKRYNYRHDRKGHLFQDRFGSSPIDTDEYLMTAMRYIHQNPLGMGVGDYTFYRWSSYREYVGAPEIVSIDSALAVFGGLAGFLEFHQLPNSDQVSFHDVFENDRYSTAGVSPDDQMVSLAKQLLGIDDLSEIAKADKAERNQMLSTLKESLSIRTIARLTGLGKGIVQRA